MNNAERKEMGISLKSNYAKLDWKSKKIGIDGDGDESNSDQSKYFKSPMINYKYRLSYFRGLTK